MALRMVISFKQVNCTAQVDNKSKILGEQLGLEFSKNESKHWCSSGKQNCYAKDKKENVSTERHVDQGIGLCPL